MSCVYKGEVINSELSQNARGGSEMMRDRLINNANPILLQNFAIHLSRPRQIYDDVKNILWLHDLAGDPENKILLDEGWKKFDHFVFVSQWQRDTYIMMYGIPYSMCTVIPNAIEKQYKVQDKDQETIRFIYHTTPHRGLQLVYPIFDALTKEFDNIHLDVYSSFEVYGWKQRDEPYENLFNAIENHPNMTYHGAVDNQTVLDALDKSHIFMYPCIWQETSCIALIEAIRSGLICIHPNYGALVETACGCSLVYNYTEAVNDHANICYSVTKNVLEHITNNDQFFKQYTTSQAFVLDQNDINKFAAAWNGVMRNLNG